MVQQFMERGMAQGVVPDRDQLLESMWQGAQLYIGAIDSVNNAWGINIPTLSLAEYREQAEDWLTDERVETAAQLPTTYIRTPLITPSLSHVVMSEQVVMSLGTASNGGVSSESNPASLRYWTDDEISGFEAGKAASGFNIIPTAYDRQREGTADEQNEELAMLNDDYPKIGVASLWHGVVLARAYRRPQDVCPERLLRDTTVRAINLEPTSDGEVPVAQVRAYGVYVGTVPAAARIAARLVVQ